MVRRAVTLALGGNLWCMRRVYGAVKDVRTPAAYLAPPVRIRAPRRRASHGFAASAVEQGERTG
jgi:hypothetical protein